MEGHWRRTTATSSARQRRHAAQVVERDHAVQRERHEHRDGHRLLGATVHHSRERRDRIELQHGRDAHEGDAAPLTPGARGSVEERANDDQCEHQQVRVGSLHAEHHRRRQHDDRDHRAVPPRGARAANESAEGYPEGCHHDQAGREQVATSEARGRQGHPDLGIVHRLPASVQGARTIGVRRKPRAGTVQAEQHDPGVDESRRERPDSDRLPRANPSDVLHPSGEKRGIGENDEREQHAPAEAGSFALHDDLLRARSGACLLGQRNTVVGITPFSAVSPRPRKRRGTLFKQP